MTIDKFRLTRTPSDAVRMISDALPVEEQWTLVETTSGSRKDRRERTGNEREKEKERSREAEKERERGRRREKDRETADAMTSTPAYALTKIMVIALAAAKERNVTGQLSLELPKFLINPSKLSIRRIQTEGTVLRPRMGKRAQELRKIDPPRSVAGRKSDRTPLIIVLRM